MASCFLRTARWHLHDVIMLQAPQCLRNTDVLTHPPIEQCEAWAALYGLSYPSKVKDGGVEMENRGCGYRVENRGQCTTPLFSPAVEGSMEANVERLHILWGSIPASRPPSLGRTCQHHLVDQQGQHLPATSHCSPSLNKGMNKSYVQFIVIELHM